MGFFNPSSWNTHNPQASTLPRCGTCGLAAQCLSPRMPPTGLGKKSILYVAEAPGALEDQRGKQLIGDAGQTLRKLIRGVGEDLEDATKTNAVICRPPKNEMKDVYIEACRPNLLKTIRDLKPKVIILLGESAVRSLIGVEWRRDLGTISQWVGWTIPSHMFEGVWICPTYHPSYVMRTNEDPALVRLVQEHLKQAYALEHTPISSPTLKDLQREVEVLHSSRLARLRLRDLSHKEGVLAFDYETTGLKPDLPRHRIVSCSFCLNGLETFAFLVKEEHHRLLSRVLQSERLAKVASNLKFEERWTRAKLNHGVVNWHWDTMIAAHVLDNRSGITSLKFQAYVLLGVPDYESSVAQYLESPTKNGFNRIDDADPTELMTYNGLDSLLEYRVSKIQQEALRGRLR